MLIIASCNLRTQFQSYFWCCERCNRCNKWKYFWHIGVFQIEV